MSVPVQIFFAFSMKREYYKSKPQSSAKIRKIFTVPMYKLLLSFAFISDVTNTVLLSGFQRSFDIRCVRQCFVNFTGLVGIVTATVYKTKSMFISLWHDR